jgi:hypothetical protein
MQPRTICVHLCGAVNPYGKSLPSWYGIPPDVCIIIILTANMIIMYVNLLAKSILNTPILSHIWFVHIWTFCYITRFWIGFTIVVQTWPNRHASKPPLWLHYNTLQIYKYIHWYDTIHDNNNKYRYTIPNPIGIFQSANLLHLRISKQKHDKSTNGIKPSYHIPPPPIFAALQRQHPIATAVKESRGLST